MRIWSLSCCALVVGVAVAAVGVGCKSSTPDDRRQQAASDLRAYLSEGVKDAARSARALALQDELDRLVTSITALRTTYTAELAALHRSHATTDDALLARAEAFRADRGAIRTQVLAKRGEMQQLLLPDEWSGYTKCELELYKAARAQGGVQ